MSNDTKKWCKIWRKTNLFFQKWQEFGEFWSKHSTVPNICSLTGSFRAKYITYDLKQYEGVIFGVQLQCPCANLNVLQLEIQKRCCYFKNVALDFVLLVLKLCPIQVVILLPLWIKLTMALWINSPWAIFSLQFQQPF